MLTPSDPTQPLEQSGHISHSRKPPLQAIGRYEILEELGRGGMGVVYAARDPRLGREVALKVLLDGTLPDQLQRFQREAQAAARVDHPHIVPVYDTGLHGDVPFLVMELVRGDSLKRIVRRDGPLDSLDAARTILPLARALARAHAAGLLHRDVKPENVLIGADGRPRLTDFGLTREVVGGGSLTESGQVVGTPAYMAPEQARGLPVDLRADVYALGATLYATLTGRPPFQAGSVLATLNAVISKEPEPPIALRPNVARELNAICLRCLAKDPAGRYATADDLADDLDRYLSDEPVHALPAGLAGRLAGSLRRNRTVVAAAAIAGALGVTLALALTRGDADLPPPSATPSPTPDLAQRLEESQRREQARQRIEQGWALADKGDLAGAGAVFEDALALDPKSVDALTARARLHAESGAYEAAIRRLDEAIAIAPDQPALIHDKALTRQMKGDLEGAIRDYTRALEIDPRYYRAYANRAMAKKLLGDGPGAIDDLDRAIEIAPNSSGLLDERGLLRTIVHQDFQGAVEDCGESLRLDPKRVSAWRHRAQAFSKLGDDTAALRDLDNAVAVGPEDGLAWALRGIVLGRLGRMRKALENLDRGLELLPQDEALRPEFEAARAQVAAGLSGR